MDLEAEGVSKTILRYAVKLITAQYAAALQKAHTHELLLQELLWIAREGLKAPLPEAWKPW
jgi:hypothetical protein